MKNNKIALTKHLSIFIMLLATMFLFTQCNKELEDIDGAMLIKQYELAGKWKVQISPKMMGVATMATGEHDAEITDEGDGMLRLKYKGFRRDPMPFEMSVDVLMRVKQGSNGELILENVEKGKQFFDADLPEGVDVINADNAPEGIEIPKDALTKGIHSNGISDISGRYKMMPAIGNIPEAMNLDLVLNPNVGLPVAISIRTNRKIK